MKFEIQFSTLIMFDKRRTLFVLLTSVILAFSYTLLRSSSTRLPFISEDELRHLQSHHQACFCLALVALAMLSMCSSLNTFLMNI